MGKNCWRPVFIYFRKYTGAVSCNDSEEDCDFKDNTQQVAVMETGMQAWNMCTNRCGVIWTNPEVAAENKAGWYWWVLFLFIFWLDEVNNETDHILLKM